MTRNWLTLGASDAVRLQTGIAKGATRREMMSWLMGAGLSAGLAGEILLGASEAFAQTPRSGGAIKVASQSASTADTVDPARSSLTTDYCRCFMFYNGLTLLDASLTPRMELAESFETTDAQNWVIKLRKGIMFHDGAELEAKDVAYTIVRQKDPKTGSSARALATQMEEVTVADKYELRIKLTTPNADLPVIFGTPHFLIIRDGTTDFSKANGTGPYLCHEFSPGVRSVARRNPNYWKNGKPYLDEIEYFSIQDETARVNALLAGDIQVASQISHRLKRRINATRGFTVMETKSGNYDSFILRQDASPTNNPDLVLAMKYLLNREQMRGALEGTVGNDQPIDPTHRFYFAGLPQRPFDLDKAKFHFAKSGLGNTALPAYAMNGSAGADKLVMLQQSAKQIGFNIDIQRMPGDGYWSRVWMKYPFTIGNINPRPSADILLSLFYKSDSPWNESAWKSEKFDQLLLAARGETDEAKRKKMYGDMQVMIYETNGVGIPLFGSFHDAYITKLKGLSPIPTGGMMGFGFGENVWLEG
ncbi:ABC transporter substrate-binding protein [Acetobacteraceae bacterium H6797]|nr:ABC transporter substrate-binding protein [Acetobacteraceae bacterium H6797]